MEQRRSIFRDGVHLRMGVFKDFWSAITHFAGFIAAIVGLVLLVVFCEPGVARVTAASIYGATLVLLFLASSTYHFFDLGERGNRWLQRIDHMAIYLFIAGTILPPILVNLEGTLRVVMLVVLATMAAGGVVLKLLWMECPEKLSVGLYLAFGWFGILPLVLTWEHSSATQVGWLLAGGIAYTLGAVVMLKRWPDPWPKAFGHHEVWHLLVLGGAVFHFFWVASILTA